MTANEYGQPLDYTLDDWVPRPYPQHKELKGRYCTLVAPNTKQASDFFEAHETTPGDWTYMFNAPYKSVDDAVKHLEDKAASRDPLYFTVIDNATGKAVGSLSYLRIEPAHGVIEVGHVTFSDKMKRSFVSTEAQYLLMKEAFDGLGYRRYEWKCHNFNEPSKKAAKRLGFTHEGVFRQHIVTNGRNRDTAWFSIIDGEWPAIKSGLEQFLAEENAQGNAQIKSLGEFMP